MSSVLAHEERITHNALLSFTLQAELYPTRIAVQGIFGLSGRMQQTEGLKIDSTFMIPSDSESFSDSF